MPVLAVNYQDDVEFLARYWRESGFDLPSFAQHRDVASRAFGVEFYTSMFVLDEEHRVLWRGHKLAPEIVRPLLGLNP